MVVCDVFVSYKREDIDRVRPLVGVLREAGLDVWWDQDLTIGGEAAFTQEINAKLDVTKSAIVCWTPQSASQRGEFVHAEASRARDRNVLVPALLEPVDKLPVPFNLKHYVDLTDWRGETSEHEGLSSLVARCWQLCSRDTPPPDLKLAQGKVLETISRPTVERPNINIRNIVKYDGDHHGDNVFN